MARPSLNLALLALLALPSPVAGQGTTISTTVRPGNAAGLLYTDPFTCQRYTVQGSDLGSQYQNLRLSRGNTPLTARVVINGQQLEMPQPGTYTTTLPTELRPGDTLNVLVNVQDCLVYATGIIPTAPVVTKPVRGGTVYASNGFSVIWKRPTPTPDRYRVVAQWVEGNAGRSWQSADLPGTQDGVGLPAGSLPPGKTVTISVMAYNDGTFQGANTPASRLSIRSETTLQITTQ